MRMTSPQKKSRNSFYRDTIRPRLLPGGLVAQIVSEYRILLHIGLSLFITVIHALLLAPSSLAQVADTSRQSITGSPSGTIQPETEQRAPSQNQSPSDSGLKEIVEFTARDSLILVFDEEEGDRGALFGNANVSYGETTLEAYRIDLLFSIDELRATGLPSDTGMVGRPRFQEGDNIFDGNELAFNLKTERGRVVAARTAIEDGFIRAGVVKVSEDSTLYIKDGMYTTCDCEDTPSYSLRSSKMKIVNQNWIYTGPIQLYIFDIPTPLWLPFGFLPAQEGRRSGPLPPRYGEDERGFYLREWGWYQAINEYMDAQVRFGIWSRGSWEVAPTFRYNRRYRYSGQLSMDYVKNRRGEKEDPDYTVYSTNSFRWNHTQTISPTANFTSNVNLSSQNYLRTVSEQYDDRVRQTVQSSIRFNKRWTSSGRSLSLDFNQRQILATGEATLTLPQLSFSQSARKPFARSQRAAGESERWYERITFNYNSSLNNRYQFKPLPDDTLRAHGDDEAADIEWWQGLFSADKYERATGEKEPFEFRASHRLSTASSFSINRLPIINRTFRLNVAPSINYTEDWFIRTNEKVLSKEENRLISSTVPGFFSLRQFNLNISSNTTFYGIFPLRIGSYSGLRHTVRPNLGFSYRPDFYDDVWGYTRSYVDASGIEQNYAIVNNVQRGLQKNMTYSISNVFETKRIQADSTGDQQSRTIQILNLDVSSSFNFAADSMKMAPISLNARTRILDRFDLRLNSTFSPYRLNNERSREINSYVFGFSPFRFARLTRLSLTASTSLRSRRGQQGQSYSTSRFDNSLNALETSFAQPLRSGDPYNTTVTRTAVGYADFAIPWSLNLNFSYNLSKPYAKIDRRAILNASFDFNLTPKWKIQGKSGYDFIQDEVVLTNVAILRDFDCWVMSINWIPFGAYQSYSFELRVKSGHLSQFLRLRQPRADVKGRFGNLIQ